VCPYDQLRARSEVKQSGVSALSHFIQGIFTSENPSIDFSNQTPGEYYLRIDGMERVTKLLKH
jgi:hypothetical protein